MQGQCFIAAITLVILVCLADVLQLELKADSPTTAWPTSVLILTYAARLKSLPIHQPQNLRSNKLQDLLSFSS